MIPYNECIEKGYYKKKVQLIDGKVCVIETKKLVGYCRCRQHQGYLNKELLKQHNCIEKECFYLDKFEDFPFWISMKNAEIRKEKRKQDIKRFKERESERLAELEKKMDMLLNTAQEMSDRLEYDIIITRAVPKNNTLKNYEYIINYVSDSLKDDWFKYYDIALMLGKLYGGKYYLKHMKHPDGSYVTIDDWCDYVVRY